MKEVLCILICSLQIALCIFVFNFSLMGYEFYTQHYRDFILGHVFAVIAVLIICFLITSFFFYVIDKNMKKSIKNSLYLSGISTIIVSIYILLDIDYAMFTS